MAAEPNLHESLHYEKQRTREEELALKNRRTGMTIFQISWIMAFIGLVVVNWQLRYSYTSWPPPGVQPLDRVLPSIATAGLLLSAVLVARAVRAIRHDDRPAFFSQWTAVVALGLAFVGVMAFEWLTVPPVPEITLTLANGVESVSPANVYNAVFRLMTAFHGVHALAGVLYMGWALRRARHGFYDSRDHWDLEAGAKLWYFVFVAWVIFYTVLYWI